jgi:transcriptional regulator
MACCRRSRLTASSRRIALGPIPARRRPAATRHLLPRPQRARARSLVHAERLAARRDAAVRVGVMQWRERDRGSPRLPPRRDVADSRGRAQLPIHASAVGKAILAYLPSSVVDDLTAEPLPRLTSRMLSARELRAQFERIRERGVARERDEAILGEAGVAAPIFDHRGRARSARWAWSATPSGSCRAGRRRASSARGRRGGRRHLPRARSALLAGTGRAAPR